MTARLASIARRRLISRNQTLDRYLRILDGIFVAVENDDITRLARMLDGERHIKEELQTIDAAVRTIDARDEQLDNEGQAILTRIRRRHGEVRSAIANRRADIRAHLGTGVLPPRARSVFRRGDDHGAMVDISL